MGITPQTIASLLAAMGGALIAFSLVTETRELSRAGGPWKVFPIPPTELTGYFVMSLAVGANIPGLGALMASFLVMPPVLLLCRTVWMVGRRTEDDPIRRAFEQMERRREGRDRG